MKQKQIEDTVMESGMAASASTVEAADMEGTTNLMEEAMGALSKELQFESLSEKEERKRENKALEKADIAEETIEE